MMIYDTIRDYREKRQWSQELMAERLGMSKNGYAKIERGIERGEVTLNLERLEQIAQILGVGIVDLLQNKDKNVVVQTQNHNAIYYANYTSDNMVLQAEIEKLHLIIKHKEELLAQKDAYITALQALLDKQ